ncbi:SgrR family transcriptional regulator [Bacillus inaquosorum]|uniref:SgrR family transcriptional regulator n=1 Tax=Bacillus inaquosorum TaxID=483913 RepID=UPI00227F5B35|nr:ABC transporter substrate-binding protein [Bacillus inaquosorum]MCY8071234.1 ABC transporter substrate-binding protein [Bacillus inaquosorum]MCY9380674.1 ABC transporter substrate-binding protein [Bacillus inaquosorum]
MKLIEHYVALVKTGSAAYGQMNEMTLTEMADSLFCTERNAKLILHKLENKNWIIRESGAGRGRKSKIAFLRQPEELLLQTAKEYTMAGKLIKAKELLQQYQSAFPGLQNEYDMWFSEVFGFVTETGWDGEKDVLRLFITPGAVSSLDPCQIFLRSEGHFVKQIFDTLLTLDPAVQEPKPHLVHGWEESGKNRWRFFLRKGVSFHNGQPLTARDVAFTFQRFLAQADNPYKWLLHGVKQVLENGPYCVDLILDKPNELLPYVLCDERLSILPAEQGGGINGSGPFRVIQHHRQMLVLEANEHYFKGRPFLDRVEFVFSEQAGEMNGFTIQEKQTCPEQQIVFDERHVQYLSLNLKKKGPLQHRSFRKALRLLISSQRLVREAGGHRRIPVTSFLHPNLLDWGGVSPSELLKQSGYEGETLVLYTFSETDHREDAEWIQNVCAQQGIRLALQFCDSADLRRPEIVQMADIIHDSATFYQDSEFGFLHLLLSQNSFLSQHLSEKLEQICSEMSERIFSTPDRCSRINMLRDIDCQLIKEFNAIPLYQNVLQVTSSENVKGLMLDEEGWIDLYSVWLSK